MNRFLLSRGDVPRSGSAVADPVLLVAPKRKKTGGGTGLDRGKTAVDGEGEAESKRGYNDADEGRLKERRVQRV
jgi:hypothetical protein